MNSEHEIYTFDALSPREQEVLQLLCKGLNRTQIRERMGISRGTLGIYMDKIYKALDAQSRTQAVVAAFRRGWVKL